MFNYVLFSLAFLYVYSRRCLEAAGSDYQISQSELTLNVYNVVVFIPTHKTVNLDAEGPDGGI